MASLIARIDAKLKDNHEKSERKNELERKLNELQYNEINWQYILGDQNKPGPWTVNLIKQYIGYTILFCMVLFFIVTLPELIGFIFGFLPILLRQIIILVVLIPILLFAIYLLTYDFYRSIKRCCFTGWDEEIHELEEEIKKYDQKEENSELLNAQNNANVYYIVLE